MLRGPSMYKTEFYNYPKLRERTNGFQFVKTFFWTPNDEEKLMISNDYKIIRDKIINGEINSERDNIFLGTCPKSVKIFLLSVIRKHI